MAAAPTAMKMLRKNSASRMPKISTVCWRGRGHLEPGHDETKTKRLSRRRLYSVIQPA